MLTAIREASSGLRLTFLQAFSIFSFTNAPDSTETYTVSRRATLKGVYNMNKGYADFKQIEVLYQNEEYSIVKSNL